MALSEFLQVEPGQRAPEAHELIVGVEFLKPSPGTRHRFLKLGRREAFRFSQLSLCMMVGMNLSGTIAHAAIAVGAVGPYAFRLRDTERLLVEAHPTDPLIEETVEEMSREVSRHLGKAFTATYKGQALRGLAREALSHCFRANH
jgi:CO/xanthine dehydrogenase FAD-binding subunit